MPRIVSSSPESRAETSAGPGNGLEARAGAPERLDVVVVGAGFGGLYALHRLRGAGRSVRVLDAASGVGGTWYWNRYPGARCDIESMQYSYQFSEALAQEWVWSERYATQPEILRYAEHVAERFDLMRDIRLDTRVTSAVFDEEAGRWEVATDAGDRISARFLVTAVGCLSTANRPSLPGMDAYAGDLYHTGHWPHEPVDFRGRTVGVIGTGSSAIQSIPLIAEQAEHLYVFQRTPNYAVPAWNAPLDPAEVAATKASYASLRAKARARPTAYYFPHDPGSALDVTPEAREAQYEAYWRRGGLPFLGAYGDLLTSPEANRTAARFAARKIRERVDDPEVAALLTPSNVFGCKRLCVDTGYYETFNRANVTLVDVSATPIEHFTADGVSVGDRSFTLDAVVLATGFDAMTGSFDQIDIRGRGGLGLREKWSAGPRTYLGLTTRGFPNLFMVTGPGSPSVLANMITSIEQHVDWIDACIEHLDANRLDTIEPHLEAEDAWVEHVNQVAAGSLRSTCSSWYVGANVPGKPRVFMPYIGGFPLYERQCAEVAEAGYRGFELRASDGARSAGGEGGA